MLDFINICVCIKLIKGSFCYTLRVCPFYYALKQLLSELKGLVFDVFANGHVRLRYVYGVWDASSNVLGLLCDGSGEILRLNYLFF